MKKLFSIVSALALALPLFAGVVTFKPNDFSGMGTSSTGSEVTVTKDGVTVSCNKAYGASESLRCYKGSNVSITSTSKIIKINFTFAANDKTGGLDAEIEVNANSWAANSLESQARFAEIAVTIDAEVIADPVDTISVSEALDRLANSKKGECYVKGKVTQIITSNVETYGNISYWLADIENPNDSIQAYRMKGAGNKDYASASDIEFVVGDEVLVYAAGLQMYHNNNTNEDIPELNTGYYVRTLKGKDIINLDWAFGTATLGEEGWNILIEKANNDSKNFIDLNFVSSKKDAIGGYHTISDGSITINGKTADITGSIKLTFKEVSGNSLNVYAVEAILNGSTAAYRLTKEIEFYATDEDGGEIDLEGDRPFTPTEDGQEATCAQAREYALSLASGAESELSLTVEGYVTDLFNTGVTFWMDDQKGSAKTLQVYSFKNLIAEEGLELANGTHVKVIGKVKNYNGTPEVINATVELLDGGATIVPVKVSVAEALAAAKALAQGKTSTETYEIHGFIAAIDEEFSAEHGNISFKMSDQLDDANAEFVAYRVNCDAALAADLLVGARVQVTAKVTHFHQNATEGDNPKPERTVYETVKGGKVELIFHTATETIKVDVQTVKFIENGQVIILRDGVRYNVQGQLAK